MAAKKHVFTTIEKKVLLDILKVYSHIVENKNTDGSTLREKNVAWENITKEYNVSPYVTTEVSNKQLKRLWMNLKQRQRETITKERQHRMATGGGPSTSSAVIDPDVAQIAPGLMVEIPGSIDSDATVILDSEDGSLNMDSNQFLEITHHQPSNSAMYIIQPDMPPPSPSLITTTTPHPLISTASTTTAPISTITTAPHPSTLSTPLFPNTIPLPPSSTSSTSAISLQRHKNSIIEKEYRDRLNRASEIHAMEKELLQHKIREAKAKADLAELLLQRERSLKDIE